MIGYKKYENHNHNDGQREESSQNDDDEIIEGDENNMHNITVTINDETFEGALYENETVEALQSQLPLTITMSDLHNNEKYADLGESLPVNKENVGTIQSGDLMLYGSDTFVLFYEDFSTSYSYTRLGYLENAEHLSDTVGTGEIEAHIESVE